MAGHYLTASEVAERWGCSPSYVRGLGRRGELVGMRLGTDWRFSLDSVKAYEAAHTASATAVETAPAPAQPIRPPAKVDGFTLPDGYEPRFPHLWGLPPREAAPAAGRGRASGKRKPALSGN